MASEKRLSGIDTVFYRLTKSAELVGDGIKTFTVHGSAKGDYVLISAKAGSSIFPAALAVGDIYYINDATDIPATGDKFYAFTQVTGCDITGISYSAGKDKVDVTTLCDRVKSYRMNRVDISGTLDAIFTTGGTSTVLGARQAYYSNFINVINFDGTSTYTKTTVNDDLLWIAVYLDETATVGEYESVLFLPVRLESNDIESTLDGATTASFGFTVIGSEYPQLVESVIN